MDYAIVSNNIFEYSLNFNVDTFDNCLSDVHCPITLSLHAVILTISLIMSTHMMMRSLIQKVLLP